MQSVSAGWLDNQDLHITSNGYITLVYNVVDDDLAAPELTDNGHLDMSDVSAIYSADVVTTKYHTFEKDLALCDGTFDTLPASAPYGYGSYVSDVISDTDGLFTTDPKITITFPGVTSTVIQKITINWSATYGEYPDSFTVTSLNGVSVVDQTIVTGNTSLVSEVSLDMVDFDSITIEINEWAVPFHRARAEKILIGTTETFTQASLKGFSMSRRCGLFSEVLPELKLKFDLDNSQGQYDPYNPSGESAYILQRQPVTAQIGFNISGTPEMISGGSYYMTSWSGLTNRDKASFEADGLISLMNGAYKKSVLGTISLYDLAEDILIDADLPKNTDGSDPWFIDTSLQSIYTTAPIGKYKHAECLQYVANAGNCLFYMDNDNQIIIKPRVETVQDYEVKPFNEYAHPDLEYIKPVSKLNVKVHEYSTESTPSLAYRRFLNPGTYSVEWDDAIDNAFVSYIGEAIDFTTEQISSVKVKALSDSLSVISYNITNTDGLSKGYLIACTIAGSDITFYEAMGVDETAYTDESRIVGLCKVDSSRFAVAYDYISSGSSTYYAKIGNIENGSITLGTRTEYPVTATQVTDICLVGDKLVSVYHNY